MDVIKVLDSKDWFWIEYCNMKFPLTKLDRVFLTILRNIRNAPESKESMGYRRKL